MTKPYMWPVLIVAVLCWASIVLCLDPGGSFPALPEGPGLTVDEIFNVEQGVYLVEQTRRLGWLNLVPGTSQEAYRPKNGFYNPDHPPLGRLWLGVHHHVARWLLHPVDPQQPFVTACARTGSATAFALTVLLVGWAATSWSGSLVGCLTALSLVLMPRLYGHAHLASLESITNLTCTAAVLSVACWWNGPLPPSRRVAVLTGVLLGLALLTKIQAILIPIPVILWSLWRWRSQGIAPLLIWGCVALLVFFGLWPYLWFDPVGHGLQYLGRTTNRATINVWYLGEKFVDKEVPWHYPFVMFFLTVPLTFHVLGAFAACGKTGTGSEGSQKTTDICNLVRCLSPFFNRLLGLRSRRHPDSFSDNHSHPASAATAERSGQEVNSTSPRDYLLLACLLFPLVVFALPGVAVYDGERLFLTTFPLWSLFVGRGWSWFGHAVLASIRLRPAAALCFLLPLVMPLWSLISWSPCQLCYYNILATPISAMRPGLPQFEADYWGVSVTRGLIQDIVKIVPEGETIAILPTLHQFQADDYRQQSPILRTHRIKTVPYQPKSNADQYVLVIHRLADLPANFLSDQPDQVLARTIRNNRHLAYLILK